MFDLVLDVPSSVGILECIERLHEVSVSRADAGYHQSTIVPTEGVLDQPGQLWVSVWDVATSLGFVSKSTDHIAKSMLHRCGSRHTCIYMQINAMELLEVHVHVTVHIYVHVQCTITVES